jgi:predicted amidophosphoribosyltransferase
MPVCGTCREGYQQAARFCPHCGVPLSGLAARIREADGASPLVFVPEADDVVVLPEEGEAVPAAGGERR